MGRVASPPGQMRGVPTNTMPSISEEAQRSRWARAATTLRAAGVCGCMLRCSSTQWVSIAFSSRLACSRRSRAARPTGLSPRAASHRFANLQPCPVRPNRSMSVEERALQTSPYRRTLKPETCDQLICPHGRASAALNAMATDLLQRLVSSATHDKQPGVLNMSSVARQRHYPLLVRYIHPAFTAKREHSCRGVWRVLLKMTMRGGSFPARQGEHRIPVRFKYFQNSCRCRLDNSSYHSRVVGLS